MEVAQEPGRDGRGGAHQPLLLAVRHEAAGIDAQVIRAYVADVGARIVTTTRCHRGPVLVAHACRTPFERQDNGAYMMFVRERTLVSTHAAGACCQGFSPHVAEGLVPVCSANPVAVAIALRAAPFTLVRGIRP